MRNKREEGRGVKVSADGTTAIQKKTSTSKSSSGRRNQENGGEMLVCYITTQGDQNTDNGFMNNPFVDNKWGDNSNSIPSVTNHLAPQDDFTKFHLEDDEMLLELMIHLHADCPYLMHDKNDLIERVSKLYDKIHKK